MRRFALVLLVLVSLVSTARAQTLAEHVPSDAIIYVGWRGAGNLGPGYEASHLKAILDGSNIPELCKDFLPQLIQKAQQKDLEAGTKMRVAYDLVSALFKHPVAYFFSGIDTSGGQPVPRVGLICDAGADADAIKQQFDQLIAAAGHTPVPIKSFKEAEIVGVLVGFSDPAKALPDVTSNSLGEQGGFKKVTMNLHADPVITAFVDGEKVLALIDKMVAQGNDAKAQQNWPKVKESAGLTGLKRIAYTAGFEGKEWTSQIFVEAPAPRRGLLAMCDNKPISDELLKAIPDSATFAAAGSFDFAKLVDQIRTIAGAIDPEAQQKIDQGLGGLSMMIGKNVQRDILEPLGEQWGVYMSPAVGGSSIGGVVVINQLDDVAKAQQGINALWTFANNMAAAQMKDKELKVQGFRTKIGDITVSYVGTPFVSPGWTIKDGRLYIALFPQIVATAARQAGGANKSIIDNPEYQKMLQRLNVQKPTSIEFMNLPATAPQAYQTALVLSRMALGFADMWGVKSPEPVLPPLDVLMPHLTPAAAASWSDDTGWHRKSITPFPGAEFIATEQNAAIGSTAMMTSILLPSLNRARETANRIKCASNMRQIGQAILLYSNENKGNYPPDFRTLILTQEITADAFVCPSGNVSLPANLAQMKPEQIANWVNEHSPYVYAGKGLKNNAPADRVVLYEKLEDHNSDGGNFLYGDGHVEFFGRPGYQQEVQKLQSGDKPANDFKL
jgi:prepilin-type processing-associated H-X9-DG protein